MFYLDVVSFLASTRLEIRKFAFIALTSSNLVPKLAIEVHALEILPTAIVCNTICISSIISAKVGQLRYHNPRTIE